MNYSVFTIMLKGLNRKRRDKMREANPKGKRKTPFYLVSLIAQNDKNRIVLEKIKRGTFGELSSWMKHGEAVTEEKQFEENKAAVIYHQSQIDQLREAGNRVWPPDDPTYSVYVIKLIEKAFGKRKFAKINEGLDETKCKGCLYVGQTGNDIEHRVKQHIGLPENPEQEQREKDIGSDIVRGCNEGEYPECVAWEYVEENLRKADSLKREEEIGRELRAKGYATYWA